MKRTVPVFSYHAVLADDRAPLPQQWGQHHAICVGAFREQLDLIAQEGWRVERIHSLLSSRLPPKTTVLTFDDGQSADLDAAQELAQRGMTATFFVTWSRLGTRAFLTRSQVVELDRQGFTIGSHGLTHSRLTALGPSALRDELAGSRERLEDLLGKPVTAIALPFGAYNTSVIAAATEAGYRPIMTSDFALAVAGKFVHPRLTITPRLTRADFLSLLTDSRMRIARRRVLNGINRRLRRIRALASAGQ